MGVSRLRPNSQLKVLAVSEKYTVQIVAEKDIRDCEELACGCASIFYGQEGVNIRIIEDDLLGLGC